MSSGGFGAVDVLGEVWWAREGLNLSLNPCIGSGIYFGHNLGTALQNLDGFGTFPFFMMVRVDSETGGDSPGTCENRIPYP